MKEHLADFSLSQIDPLHEADVPKHLDKMLKKMKDGWKGRPLLVVYMGDQRWRALTGSHRIAAAKQLNMESVPCLIIFPDNPEELFEEFDREYTYKAYTRIGRKLSKRGFYLAAILISKDYNGAPQSKKQSV